MDDAGDSGTTEDGDMMEAEGADDSSADGDSPNPDMAGQNARNLADRESYRIFEAKFDEVVLADELCDPQELDRLRTILDRHMENVTSVVGSMGNAGQSNYAATKAGAEGMARSLARELGSRSITVNCVAPGFIDTDMTRALADAQRYTLQSQIPLGRLGEPDDIAATVAFLASDAGQYITGETIHVNGGLYMG